MTTSFKGQKGATYGFTDEAGNAVTRNADDDGVVTARNAFEEAHFSGLGLKIVEPEAPKAAKSGSRTSSKPKSAAAPKAKAVKRPATDVPAGPAASVPGTAAQPETTSSGAAPAPATTEG